MREKSLEEERLLALEGLLEAEKQGLEDGEGELGRPKSGKGCL